MGFPTVRFVKAVDPNLICGICSNVLETPTLTPCGHTFCESCINQWLDTANVRTCPECRSTMDKSSVRPILSLRNFILHLEVTCPNAHRGCKDSVTLETLDAHQTVCPHSVVVCQACQKQVDKSRFAQHRANCHATQATNAEDEIVAVEKRSHSHTAYPDCGLDNYNYKSPGMFPRVQRDDNGQAHLSYLLQRISNLEKQVARLLDDLHDAHRKNYALYFQNRHHSLKEHSFERRLKEHSSLNSHTNFGLPFDFTPCQQDIGKLSLYIARYLLHKPPGLDSDKVFCAIRKCYELQFFPANSNSNLDIHMLLATAYSSNWFSGAQRILLGCWLQCVLKDQDVRKCA